MGSCQKEDISVSPKAVALDYYTESYDAPGSTSPPTLKVQYEYDGSARLVNYTVYGLNTSSGNLEKQRYFVFSYVDGKVDKIEGFLTGATDPYIKYVYGYLPDARVSKITENNISAGVNSEANFSYSSSGDTVRVVYTFSNGGGFEYEFLYQSENIQTDKTTRGAQACSDGSYTYDQHANPFRNLGYVDYMLTNLSVNNKLTEAVNYVGCAFPTLIPEAYAYEYDERGYPTVATTSYKSSGATKKSHKKFFYKAIR